MLYISPKTKIYVDVTKAPYFADPTGQTDCTDALCRALDDILIREIEGVKQMRAKLMAHPEDNIRIGFENRKVNGVPTVIFPEDPPPTRILYFPEGTYLISDTVTYSFENLRNTINDRPSSELNRFIHFKGAGRDKTVIRLKDHCHAFRYGECKPMIAFCRSTSSNVSMMNTIEDMTLDAGVGNAGAIGLRYASSNTGRIRNVTIRTSDPEYRGYAGYTCDLSQAVLVDNLVIDGFEYGLKFTNNGASIAFDNLTVRNCTRTALHLTHTNCTVRCSHLSSFGAAIYTTENATLSVLDTTVERQGKEGGTAIRIYTGHAYFRRLNSINFGETLVVGYRQMIKEQGMVPEFNTHGELYRAFPCEETMVDIRVPEFPHYEWDGNLDEVAEVADFGAIGDGVTDATDAIQAAFNSGKSYIVFDEGRYLVSREITIPPSVRAINFVYCDFAVTPAFAEDKEHGIFAITEPSDCELYMDDAFVFEKVYGYVRFIRHAAKRDLVVNNIHVQTGAFYFNTVGGSRVFLSNTACTMGIFGGKGYGATPCYHFTDGQLVYARHFNPERSRDNCLVDGGSTLWVFGFKTEGPAGRGFTVRGGSFAEFIGGTATIATNDGTPCIENTESSVFAFFMTDGCGPCHQFRVAVAETQNGITRCLDADIMPERSVEYYKIAGYIGVHHDSYPQIQQK